MQDKNEIFNSLNIDYIKGNSLVYNDYKSGKQVLKTLLDCLRDCEEFKFTVAFITASGLAKLKMILDELRVKGIKGKIITTNYLFFSEPKTLREMMNIPNLELRMYYLNNSSEPGFHTKGYIFRKGNTYDVIVGSSNLTQNALTVNKEWNIRVQGTEDAITIKNVNKEFDNMWENGIPMNQIIDTYETQYNLNHVDLDKPQNAQHPIKELTPNAMQLAFTTRLNELIANGENKALLISATGTGKTFASAFGIRDIKGIDVKKILFITHRELILKQAQNTYNIVFGSKAKTTLFTGNHKDIGDANMIFASFHLLIKEKYRKQFKPDEFDVVIIDEVHKVGDNHYQDIINYFKPKFLLGMSATPDRTDGYDIYKLFDHNIAYEVRLDDALESNMLTPFNYYGITDFYVDGKIVDDNTEFQYLVGRERVKKIISKAKYYGYSGKRLKGLVFVSRIEEGRELSNLFNTQGYNTVFLDGSVSQAQREEYIQMLEEDDVTKPHLDYIFTVDIFNEGVDIPSVNQIILLRPTQSSIIFIQQLGRGLRLYDDKEFVTVLDFIGNYDNNYLIAKALNTNKTTHGDLTRRVHDPILGKSSIQFDQIARERIYASIDKAKVNSKLQIYKDYIDIKNKLGHIPTLLEFEDNGDQPARVFLDMQIYNSYYDFLVAKDDYPYKLDPDAIRLLRYMSKFIGDGKRREELLCLRQLKDYGMMSYNATRLDSLQKSVVSILDGSFNSGINEFSKNKTTFIKRVGNRFHSSDMLAKALKDIVFESFFDQIVNYGIYSNDKHYNSGNELVHLEKYTRRDAIRLICGTKNVESTVYGYKQFKDQGELPIFVSYHKVLEDDSGINYQDRFIDENTFEWFSRSRRTLNSNEIKNILDQYDAGELNIRLFVQKANSDHLKDDSGFYYIGKCTIVDKKNALMKNGDDVVKFLFTLDKPCRSDVYDYLIKPL